MTQGIRLGRCVRGTPSRIIGRVVRSKLWPTLPTSSKKIIFNR